MAIRKYKYRSRRAVTRRSTRKANTRSYRRASNGGQPWSGTEISFMRKNYRTHTTVWCAKQLGRTVYSVRYKASDLNIKKANPSKWVDFKLTGKTRTTKKRYAKSTTRRRTSRRATPRRTSRSRRY